MAFTEKLLTVRPPIEVAGRHIKRYHVTADPAGIAPDVEKAAYEILPELLPEPDGTPPAAFAVLHRGADTGAYLNVYSWVWDNVLHCRTASAGSSFLGSRAGDLVHFHEIAQPWIGCVWELPALRHEPGAWVRHMLEQEAHLTDRGAIGHRASPRRFRGSCDCGREAVTLSGPPRTDARTGRAARQAGRERLRWPG